MVGALSGGTALALALVGPLIVVHTRRGRHSRVLTNVHTKIHLSQRPEFYTSIAVRIEEILIMPIAVVTGANSGIGHAFAKLLIDEVSDRLYRQHL